MAKKKKQGHFCKICGERKSNEAFRGAGHAGHICKECNSLPQERKNELQIINRIGQAGEKYPKSRDDWNLLEKYAKNNKYPEAKEFALFFLNMSGRQISETTNRIEKAIHRNTIIFCDLDEYTQEDISDDIYERITDFFVRKSYLPGPKDKLKILDKVCKEVSRAYGDQLLRDAGLENLFDEILRSISIDLEQDE